MDTLSEERSVSEESLASSLLVAVPSMKDPTFAKTIILLIHNGEDGSSGVVLNRQAPHRLSYLLEHFGLPDTEGTGATPVWQGGPVQPEGGMILYRHHAELPDFEPWVEVLPGVRASWSIDLLEAIADGDGPLKFALFMGRAAWLSGQLEAELADGSWIPMDVEHALLFPEEGATDRRWSEALDHLGVQPSRIVPGEPAHA